MAQEKIIILTLEQIQKSQTPGAEKSPKKLLQEQASGQTTFIEDDKGLIFRLVSSVTMMLMDLQNPTNYWKETGQWKFDPKSKTWNLKERKYPFPGEGIENHEPPQIALERGLREEFGLSFQDDVAETILPPGLAVPALQTSKASHTAGFETIYQFYPFQMVLEPGVKITSSLPPDFPHKIPEGEIWRLDTSVSGGPKKVLCFKSIPFPKDWKEQLLTI